MPQIQLVAVGKLREPHWRDAAEAYVKRLRRGCDFVETIVKDGDASLAPHDRSVVEGDRILQHIKGAVTPICLDEKGEMLSSTAFAQFLRRSFDTAQTPCFIVGGAYGVSEAVKKRAVKTFSLSPMTFTHEMARVLLLEQLYRADAILRGAPYHHA